MLVAGHRLDASSARVPAVRGYGEIGRGKDAVRILKELAKHSNDQAIRKAAEDAMRKMAGSGRKVVASQRLSTMRACGSDVDWRPSWLFQSVATTDQSPASYIGNGTGNLAQGRLCPFATTLAPEIGPKAGSGEQRPFRSRLHLLQ